MEGLARGYPTHRETKTLTLALNKTKIAFLFTLRDSYSVSIMRAKKS